MTPAPRDRHEDQHAVRGRPGMGASADGLDEVLDIEAGLREILLHSRHDTAVDALGTVLDTDTGLAAILPVPPPPAPEGRPAAPSTGPDATARQSPQPVSASERLALRTRPDVALVHSTFTHALALSRDLERALDRTLALDGTLALGLSRDLERALDRTRTLSLHLEERALDLQRSLANELAGASTFAGALDHAFNTGDFLNAANARALVSGGLERALDHARSFADLATEAVRRTIGAALTREPPPLDRDSAHAFLNDFTDSDLHTADLTGLDLEGVRWSEEGTRWPPSTDIDDLKNRSRETPAGSGVWVIRSGTTTARDLADLA